MKVLVGVVIGTLLLVGCDSGHVKKSKEAVADRLRDPDSAQFRNIKSGKASNGLETVCGEVNGKNAYGAYSGYERFIANNGGRAVYLESQWPTFSVLWITDCPS
ncbi:hypothetical protein ACT3UJ_12520 [Halomonas sp. 86]|uniref:hypothetical protein n=1 Tax=unclassified Halomonas TaxID=2609666 RepID=UPI004033EE4A